MCTCILSSSWHSGSGIDEKKKKRIGRHSMHRTTVFAIWSRYDKYVVLRIELYTYFYVYKMPVLIDNAFCRQFQRQRSQYVFCTIVILFFFLCFVVVVVFFRCLICFSFHMNIRTYTQSCIKMHVVHVQLAYQTVCAELSLLLWIELRPNWKHSKEDNKDKSKTCFR